MDNRSTIKKENMSKIDTQGMSGPVDPNYKGSIKPQKHKL